MSTKAWLSLLLLLSFADRDMYVRFVGFGVGHAIQYNQSLMEHQATEEVIFDDTFEDDANAFYDGETPCDTDIGADENDDVFEGNEVEASEVSDIENEFSDIEVNESEGEEGPEFRF